MPTAEDVLRVARSQLGVVEGADGSNPYGRAYGVDRVWWCAQFVWWCFREAGAANLIHPKTAYTPTLAQWFIDRRQWHATPAAGDLVFYDWPDAEHRIQHVGLVEAVEPAAIVTIEGNTTSGAAGSQSNGDGVYRRRRARNASIVGYGRPAYTPTASTAPQEDDMSWTTAEGAPDVPDFYAEGLPPLPDPRIALAWATAHAAHARDRAIEARDRAIEARRESAALREEIAQLRAALTDPGARAATVPAQLDYQQLAAALLAGIAGSTR